MESEDGIFSSFLKSFKGAHSALYRPLSVWIYTLLFRGNNTPGHTSFWFSLLFAIYGFSVFIIINRIKGGRLLSFFVVFFFLLLPPSLFLAWKTYDTNLPGLFFSFFSLYFFLGKRHPFYLFLSFLFCLLAILSGEGGRIAAFLLLLSGWLYYRRERAGFIFLSAIFLFLLVFLFVIAPEHTASFKRGPLLGSRVLDFLYYPGFLLSHYIYALDTSIPFFLIASFLSKHTRQKSAVYLSLLPAVYFFPSYPFRNFDQGFVFITDDPVPLFFIFIVFLISLIGYLMDEPAAGFSSFFTIIFSLSFLAGVLFYPHVRADTSARSLVYTYPFLLLIAFLKMRELLRTGMAGKVLSFLYFLPFLFHLIAGFLNLRSEEIAKRKGMDGLISLPGEVERFERRRWALLQIFIDYEAREVFFPTKTFRKMEMEYLYSSLFDREGLERELEEAFRKRCGFAFYILFKRFRAEVFPYPLSVKEEEVKAIFEKAGDLGKKLLEYRMFSPEVLPVEGFLSSRFNLFKEKEWSYYSFPCFLSELLERIITGLPLKIRHSFLIKVYRAG